jgi:hypothetical protein
VSHETGQFPLIFASEIKKTKEYGSNYTLPFGTPHQVGNPNHMDINLRNSKFFPSDYP